MATLFIWAHLIDKVVLDEVILEAGVLDSIILPTDHRITVAMILNEYSNNKNKTLTQNNNNKRNNAMRDVSM